MDDTTWNAVEYAEYNNVTSDTFHTLRIRQEEFLENMII